MMRTIPHKLKTNNIKETENVGAQLMRYVRILYLRELLK